MISKLYFKKNIIRIFGTQDNPLFIANHIGKSLGLTNIRKSIRDYDDDCKMYKVLKLPNNIRRYKYTMLTTRGLEKLLLKTRKDITDFIKFLDDNKILHINEHQRFVPIETETLRYISKSFNGECMITQYRVGNYYIDMYFPKYKIAIECDENGHSDRNTYDEADREKYINKKLGCSWIRYNPHEPKFCVFELINKIYLLIQINK